MGRGVQKGRQTDKQTEEGGGVRERRESEREREKRQREQGGGQAAPFIASQAYLAVAR